MVWGFFPPSKKLINPKAKNYQCFHSELQTQTIESFIAENVLSCFHLHPQSCKIFLRGMSLSFSKIMNSLIPFLKNDLVLAFVVWYSHRHIYCMIWKMHQAIRSRTGPESVIDCKYLAKSFSSCAFSYLLSERWILSEVLREDFGFCLQVYLLS